MRSILLAAALVLVAVATPAIGSFHETIGVVPDRAYSLAMSGTSFNGLHAPQAPLLEAYLGERVRFLTIASEGHTFHLHGHPWRFESGFIDTFLVTPQTPHAFDVTAGSADKHPGDWMYHCHFDEHMAAGMWGIFRVYPFRTQLDEVGHTLEVTLDRLGEPVEGAALSVAVDGIDIPAHIQPMGGGRYHIHAALPDHGALVVTADHATLGQSVARLALDDTLLPTLTVEHGTHS